MLWEITLPGELVLYNDAGTQAWVGNLRSPHFLVLEMFVLGTRTKKFGFFSMLLLGIPLDFQLKNNQWLKRKIYKCSFCSKARDEAGGSERHRAGRRCVSSQGFLPAPPRGRAMALLPLTAHLPADLPALGDRVAKAGVPQVVPLGT